MAQITVYTRSGDAVCARLCAYLGSAGLRYVERVVDRDGGLIEEMFAHGLPVTVLSTGGRKALIIGYQPDTIVEALHHG